MPYAIQLYLDEETDKRIEVIKDLLRSEEIPVDDETRSHISFAIYDTLSVEEFTKELWSYSTTLKPIKIKFASLGIFLNQKPVFFLGPKVNHKLLDRHQQFHEYFSDYDGELWEYYHPEEWVPHCTLALGLEYDELNEACRLLSGVDFPFSGYLNSIGILEFSPNQQLVEYEFKL